MNTHSLLHNIMARLAKLNAMGMACLMAFAAGALGTSGQAMAQEVMCSISVNSASVQGTNKTIYDNMRNACLLYTSPSPRDRG